MALSGSINDHVESRGDSLGPRGRIAPRLSNDGRRVQVADGRERLAELVAHRVAATLGEQTGAGLEPA